MMFKKRRTCDFPPCTAPSHPHTDRYGKNPCDGECDKHGHWETCQSHSSVDHARHAYECPVCRHETWQQQQRNEAEAKRRNDANPPSPYADYVAEYKRQGYGQEAAEALAQKQLRGNPPPPVKHWTAGDIWQEQHQLERKEKIRQGTLAVCPNCRQDVPVSDWIILSHQAPTGRMVSGYDGYESEYKTCPGTGSSAKLSSARQRVRLARS
jgi:hypothetical protein